MKCSGPQTWAHIGVAWEGLLNLGSLASTPSASDLPGLGWGPETLHFWPVPRWCSATDPGTNLETLWPRGTPVPTPKGGVWRPGLSWQCQGTHTRRGYLSSSLGSKDTREGLVRGLRPLRRPLLQAGSLLPGPAPWPSEGPSTQLCLHSWSLRQLGQWACLCGQAWRSPDGWPCSPGLLGRRCSGHAGLT